MSAPGPEHSKDNPFPAPILENRPLTKPGSGKETRHVVVGLEGSGFTYEAGDSLGVYPTNPPDEVAEILGLLGATGGEPVLLPKLGGPIPLREALASKLALAVPGRKFVEMLAERAADSAERARLAGLLAPEGKDRLEGFLAERQLVDLLAEFPSARFAPQEVADALRRLLPRLYSAASSPRSCPGEIHLTVAVVRYRSNGRDRVGICSGFLAERAPAGRAAVPVFISHSHFRLPEDPARDIVMVGPGTGVAPFRAFMQERAVNLAGGRNWLFFGEQRRASDFLYEEEWSRWLAAGRLWRLDTAFSRDQPQKIYVQDRMRENAGELWRWIKGGAYFYVCGDARRMARDVEATLRQILVREGSLSEPQAEEYLRQMKKDRRYQRDVY